MPHVAFKREAGVGLFENIPGWTGSPAEVALAVFLAVDHIFVPAHAFRLDILTGIDRNKDVFDRVPDQPDTGPGRIVGAIFGRSVKGCADYLTCLAAIALIHIDFNCLNFLLNFVHFL